MHRPHLRTGTEPMEFSMGKRKPASVSKRCIQRINHIRLALFARLLGLPRSTASMIQLNSTYQAIPEQCRPNCLDFPPTLDLPLFWSIRFYWICFPVQKRKRRNQSAGLFHAVLFVFTRNVMVPVPLNRYDMRSNWLLDSAFETVRS